MRFGFYLMALALAGLAAFPAQAQEAPGAPMAEAVQGIWSAPDCAESRSVLVFSRFYTLSLHEARHRLDPVRAWRSEGLDGEALYTYRTSNQDGYLFRISNDGLMKYVPSLIHPQQPLQTAWGVAEDALADEYSHCAKLFSGNPLLSQDEVNLPFLLDRIRESCAAIRPDDFAKAASCHLALFETLDSDSDQKLNGAELARLYRHAIFLASASNTPCAAQAKPWPGTVTQDARDFASRALTLLDGNKDMALDMTEARQGWSDPLARGLADSLLQLLRPNRTLLPFLPLSEAERICSGPSDTGTPEAPFTGQVTIPSVVPSPLNPEAQSAGGCGCGLTQNESQTPRSE